MGWYQDASQLVRWGNVRILVNRRWGDIRMPVSWSDGAMWGYWLTEDGVISGCQSAGQMGQCEDAGQQKMGWCQDAGCRRVRVEHVDCLVCLWTRELFSQKSAPPLKLLCQRNWISLKKKKIISETFNWVSVVFVFVLHARSYHRSARAVKSVRCVCVCLKCVWFECMVKMGLIWVYG